MSGIIRVKTAGFDRYEELLLLRDQYRKDADHAFMDYVREFGEEIRANFELKVDCISIRKSIAYCQAALNHGKKIDAVAMQQMLTIEMQQYYDELQQMTETNEACQHLKTISAYDVQQVKKLYHELAKQLHPDINPETSKSKKLMDIWNRIVTAYKANDLSELEALQVLANKALNELGLGREEIEIPDIENRITELEEEIKRIVNKDPYQYRFLLRAPDLVEQKHDELKKEHAEYEEARQQLKAILDDLMKKGNAKWVLN